MKKIVSLSLIGLLSSCFALSIPKQSIYDKRVVNSKFNENDVVQIYAKNGYTTIIKLDEDERIFDMASGFNDGWDFKDRRNYIFIKPKAYVSNIATNEMGETVNKTVVIDPSKKEWSTNFVVLTNKREYVFDLVLANHEVYYKVSFSYPDNEAKAIEQKLAKEELAKEEKFVDKELNKTTIPRNWDYYMNINKDSENITPNFAYDDGLFTYLGFDSTKTIPSVFKYENEKESILNTHVKKDGVYDVLVIHKTTKMIVLRSGNKIVGILNGSFGVNPLPVPNNTISNKVDREVIDGNK